MAVPLGDLARQHGAGGAVGVADRRVDRDRLAGFDGERGLARSACGRARRRSGWFWRSAWRSATFGATSGLWKMREKSSPFAFQWSIGRFLVEQVGPADHLVEVRKPICGQQLAHLLGDEEEVVDDVLGRALEALAQHRILRRDADRAGVQVALAHHDAAGRDQRRGREAELVGAEQRADDDVASGAQAAVDLQGDAAAQAVQHQRLLRLGKAHLPGLPACLSEVSGDAPVPPSKPEMVMWSARALATPAATVPTPTSETSFTETSAAGLTFFRS